uniref:Uncharacterized protein n=1 Tax=Clavispora lusitaniae TaxID=36911 RepID=S5TFS9_CLALS|nr:hypothetical protein [Clavispora lusitaniae]AGS44302.1 hypothetical protein [Clavispora lusitaniae]
MYTFIYKIYFKEKMDSPLRGGYPSYFIRWIFFIILMVLDQIYLPLGDIFNSLIFYINRIRYICTERADIFNPILWNGIRYIFLWKIYLIQYLRYWIRYISIH